jgi:hypothetical protein
VEPREARPRRRPGPRTWTGERLRRNRPRAQRPLRGRVDALLAAAERAGGTITKPAAVNAVGFYSSAFTDPDGYAWEVAYNPGFPLADDGTVTIPDFGEA